MKHGARGRMTVAAYDAAASARPATRNPSRTWRRYSLYLVAGSLAAFMLMTFTRQMMDQSSRLATLRDQRTSTAADLAHVQQQGLDLQQQLTLLGDDKYLEQQARKLGYIKDGEVPLLTQPAASH